MRRLTAFLSVVILSLPSVATAQTRRPPARRTAPEPLMPPVTVAPEITCPTPLGVGVATGRSYCDVLSGRDPAGGILVPLPPHRGPVTLTFDLHNRHTYSEEQVKANRAYARYTAVIGALTLDNTLIRRAVVQSEFRKASDLVERIGGGAGPAGVKAVAPTGTEHVMITIPEAESQVSILGEKLIVDRLEGSATYASAGRPIAVISNVMIEYHPEPPPKPVPPGKPVR
jgi:hypothetical protein